MKAVLIACAAFVVMAANSAHAQEVRVTLTGVQARGGDIYASLQTQDQFMQPRGTYGAMQAAPARNGSVTLVFPNVAPGDYSLSVMHDENGDRQMQREADGRPLEGWAMHNGAAIAAAHAPPTFAQAEFSVGAAPVALTEAMIYPAR